MRRLRRRWRLSAVWGYNRGVKDEKPAPSAVTRRDFFAKLLKGAKYAAPSVTVMSMAHLAHGQASAPHPPSMMTMTMP